MTYDTNTISISPPAPVIHILRTLRAEGFEAYAVGGCVRDSLLGRVPHDWDITTSALPADIIRIFRRTVETGIAHGTVTVLLDDEAFEITTFRVDGTYSDGRHPDQVSFTSSLEEDLQRRDFTINAMAWNEEKELVDLYGGADDLRERRIRCVGAPEERFSEDALRILRAVRFSAQLDFRIDEAAFSAMRTLAPSLAGISAERICAELLKLLGSDHPDYLRAAWEAGITAVILPEFDRCMQTPQNNPHHLYTVGGHLLVSMQSLLLPAPDGWTEEDASRLHQLALQAPGRLDCRTLLALTMLLHDIAKPACKTTDENGTDHFKGHATAGAVLAEEIMRRLKLDNDTISRVSRLIFYHDWRVEPDARQVRRATGKVTSELFPLLLEVQLADAMAQSLQWRAEKMNRILQVFLEYEQILAARQCLRVRDLAVNGKDLLELGVPEGPQIGSLLQLALEAVLEDPSRNSREELLSVIRKAVQKPPAD